MGFFIRYHSSFVFFFRLNFFFFRERSSAPKLRGSIEKKNVKAAVGVPFCGGPFLGVAWGHFARMTLPVSSRPSAFVGFYFWRHESATER